MLTPVIEILNYITISQLILFFFFFILRRQGNKLSNRLLAFLFLTYALWLTTYYLNWRHIDYFLEHAPRLVWTFDPFAFCIGPLLLLYTFSIVIRNFKLNWLHGLLFTPFLVYVYFTVTRLLIKSPDEIRYIVHTDTYMNYWELVVLFGIVRFMNPILSGFSIYTLFKRKDKLFNHDENKIATKYKWQLIVLIGATSVFVFELINYFYWCFTLDYFHPRDAIFFIMYVSFNLLIYSGLSNPSIFIHSLKNVKYKNSLLTEEEKENILKKVIECMEIDKFYLLPALTLQELAEKAGTHPRYVSQVINEKKGQNIIDFVNTFRVKESMKLLSDPKSLKYSMNGILMEAGFNSRTAFNIAFKKVTGYTPKEFQQIKIKDNNL